MPNENSRDPFEPIAGLTRHEHRELMRIVQRIHRGEEVPAIAELLKDRGRAIQSVDEAREAAEKLEKMLTGLLQAQPMLCRLETLYEQADGSVRAVVRPGSGPALPVAIHPSVDLDDLRNLKRWDYVLVAQKEMVVIGTWADDPFLWKEAQGDVVEFRGYYEGQRDMAWIAPQGRPESIVHLDASLCEQDQELALGASLVLQRDAPHWAIAKLTKDVAQSRYKVPVETLNATLDDLAGLDDVAEQLLEKILIRAIFHELRESLDLDRLRGVLLHSKKPGQGKTALIRALAPDMYRLGRKRGFDFELWSVQPNELKSKWHGQDGQNVRDLDASVRARIAAQDPARQLVLWIYFDECDSLGSRTSTNHQVTSSAQNDVVQSLLPVLDGLQHDAQEEEGRACVLFWGLTNNLGGVDSALRRPGRFGDLVLEFPDYSIDAAEAILFKYARKASIPYSIDGEVLSGVSEEEIRRQVLQPALARVFDAPVMYYTVESHGQQRKEVTAGEVLSGASFRGAMNAAKERAAVRKLRGHGTAGVTLDDLTEALVEQSRSAAGQLVDDQAALRRILDVKGTILDTGTMPLEDLQEHRYLRLQAG